MIKRAGMNEAAELANLAIQMWTDHEQEELEADICLFRSQKTIHIVK